MIVQISENRGAVYNNNGWACLALHEMSNYSGVPGVVLKLTVVSTSSINFDPHLRRISRSTLYIESGLRRVRDYP